MIPGWDNIVAWITKWAFALILGGVVFLASVGAYLWHKHNVEQAASALPKAQVEIQKGQVQSGKDAANTVDKNGQDAAKTDEETRKSNDTILKSPGAKTGLDPALDDAGRRAVCMRESAKHLLECQQLLQSHPK